MAAPVAAEVLDGAMATVEYRIARGRHDAAAVGGAWLAGAEIESSAARRQPLTFEVGSRMVLPVLDHAVRRLAVGEETAVTTTARDAFGPDWCSANDTSLHEEMVVAVRLLGVSWPYEALEKEVTARLAYADEAKTRGNELYRTKEPRRALQCYRSAEKALSGMQTILKESQYEARYRNMMTALRLNMAACCIQCGESWTEKAIAYCSKVLAEDEHNTKALFRRAQAYKQLGIDEEARSDLVTAAALEPQNKEVLLALAKLHPA
eukprot:Tamp_20682.p1 GENE.Tamp_20682~~Tamp_20682.p1  ORF type:complete len:264 (-),score=52.99 Tamp_20682:181-972(-)